MIIGKQTETNEDAKIDLKTLIRTRCLISANSGGGKSWIIRRLLEQTHGKVQQMVIDLDGEFETLREKYDYLLVGRDGEIPADIKTAEILAKRLLEINVSTILDLSELKNYERVLFVKRFLDSLINSPKKLWHPVMVIVDEAHHFCPQSAKSESASSVIDLMTRGRKRGFAGVLATQRISKLHKDACAEANNRLIGRTGLDVDRKRASEELGFTSKEDELSLRNLEPGDFYAFGPAISKEIVKVKVGKVETTHPDIGQQVIQKPSVTPENIKKVLKDITDLSKEAEEELHELEDYKKKVMELKRQLTLTQKGMPPQQVKVDHHAVENAKKEGYKTAEIQYSKLVAEFKGVNNEMKKRVDSYERAFIKINQITESMHFPEMQKITAEIKPMVIPKVEPIKHESVTNQSQVSNGSDTNDLSLCAKKIYSFLYNNSEKGYTKHQLGAITGYSHKSGGFNNAIYRLTASGLIDRDGSNLKVKSMNPEIAQDFDYSINSMIHKLAVCPRKIYQLLLDNPYQEYSKEEIAEQTGYSAGSGGFNNAIYRLNTLGLIKRESNTIKLNPDILEMGK